MKKKKKKSVAKQYKGEVGAFFILENGDILGVNSDGSLQIVSASDNDTPNYPIPVNPEYR